MEGKETRVIGVSTSVAEFQGLLCYLGEQHSWRMRTGLRLNLRAAILAALSHHQLSLVGGNSICHTEH